MKKISLSFGSILLCSTISFAQVEGDVKDKNNLRIQNGIVSATDTTGLLIDTAMTDNRGFYFFKNLKPGKYYIEAKAEGYATAVIKNVVVKKELNRANEWDDSYYSVRINIVMTASKKKSD